MSLFDLEAINKELAELELKTTRRWLLERLKNIKYCFTKDKAFKKKVIKLYRNFPRNKEFDGIK